MLSGPGLSVARFVDSLTDNALRGLLDRAVLSILDAVFGGRIRGERLRRIVETFIDFGLLLTDERERARVLGLLPAHKQEELRARMGWSIGQPFEGSWAEAEVRQVQEFFGLMEERILPSLTPAIDPVTPSYGLFDHQRTAVRKLRPLLAEDERRAVLHLPTGVGKTRTTMHIVAQTLRMNDPSVVVWLASGRELLEQAAAAFREAWSHLGNRPLQLATMWGDRMPNLDRLLDGFLVTGLAKGWSVLSSGDPDWAIRLADRVRLVVFDEAHQSIARTYRRLTEELTVDWRCGLLGLTATPGRTWADIDKDGELALFFGRNKVTLEVASDNPIRYLIDNGYLAQPLFRTLLSEPGVTINDSDIDRIAAALDIPPDVVEALSMNEQYVAAVLEAIAGLLDAGHRRVLTFAATVEHAHLLAAILTARNVHSRVVVASTPRRVRARAIRSFRSGDHEPMVLVNFGVLTTGFDAPQASAVVIARPTKSLVLYSQMVGRAIRGPKAGGTETCEIVTVVDPNLAGFGDVAAAFLNWEDVWQ